MVCNVCGEFKGAIKSFVVYEDQHTAVLLDQNGISGQVLIATRIHLPILESIPDPLLMHLGNLTAKTAAVIYKTLNTDGTNIIINNGLIAGQKEPHFSISIIPRYDNDGIKLLWQQKTIPDTELDELHKKITQEIENTTKSTEDKQDNIEKPKTTQQQTENQQPLTQPSPSPQPSPTPNQQQSPPIQNTPQSPQQPEEPKETEQEDTDDELSEDSYQVKRLTRRP
jgi:histidine triad (HIT) family protein